MSTYHEWTNEPSSEFYPRNRRTFDFGQTTPNCKIAVTSSLLRVESTNFNTVGEHTFSQDSALHFWSLVATEHTKIAVGNSKIIELEDFFESVTSVFAFGQLFEFFTCG